MAIFKQKIIWLGTLAVLAVLVIFGAAMMGSVVGAKPQEVPVALVVLDRAAELPGGESLAAGQMLKDKLTAAAQLPIAWHIVGTEEEALAGLDDRQYYGALILPADLSAGIASLTSGSPQPATVKLIANEGLNTQAATVVKQGLGQALRLAGAEMSKGMLERIGAQTQQMPVAAAQALLSPFVVQEETAHAVGANNASGNAPGLLTQLMWMGSLISALILFFAGSGAIKTGARRLPTTAWQAAAGLVLVGLASAFVVWMASSWYGMELAQAAETWLFLWLVGAAFFMIQSALLNWIGMPAMAILVLLMFFSMPLLNMAPEFLSQASHDWLYAWTPLRFAASGLREVMYFGGLDAAASNAVVLWSVGGGFLLLLAASGVKRVKPAVQAQPAAETA